jgi:hypothetical protein
MIGFPLLDGSSMISQSQYQFWTRIIIEVSSVWALLVLERHQSINESQLDAMEIDNTKGYGVDYYY